MGGTREEGAFRDGGATASTRGVPTPRSFDPFAGDDATSTAARPAGALATAAASRSSCERQLGPKAASPFMAPWAAAPARSRSPRGRRREDVAEGARHRVGQRDLHEDERLALHARVGERKDLTARRRQPRAQVAIT